MSNQSEHASSERIARRDSVSVATRERERERVAQLKDEGSRGVPVLSLSLSLPFRPWNSLDTHIPHSGSLKSDGLVPFVRSIYGEVSRSSLCDASRDDFNTFAMAALKNANVRAERWSKDHRWGTSTGRGAARQELRGSRAFAEGCPLHAAVVGGLALSEHVEANVGALLREPVGRK